MGFVLPTLQNVHSLHPWKTNFLGFQIGLLGFPVEQKGRHRCPETRFSTISCRILGPFSTLVNVVCDRLHAHLDTCEIVLFPHSGRDFNQTTSSTNERKIARKSIRMRICEHTSDKSTFLEILAATSNSFGSPWGASEPSQAPLLGL